MIFTFFKYKKLVKKIRNLKATTEKILHLVTEYSDSCTASREELVGELKVLNELLEFINK